MYLCFMSPAIDAFSTQPDHPVYKRDHEDNHRKHSWFSALLIKNNESNALSYLYTICFETRK